MKAIFALALLAVAVDAGITNNFHYHEQDKWGETCISDESSKQSPVDLFTGMKGEGAVTGWAPLSFTFEGPAGGTWTNTGKTLKYITEGPVASLQSTGQKPNPLFEEDDEFSLTDFVFHAPSEHTVDGKRYPLEAQFHFTSGEKQTNVGVFFTATEEGGVEILSNLFEGIPHVGAEQTRTNQDLSGLVPEGPFFSYEGSATTPPCKEGVQWVVYKNALPINQVDLDRFEKYYRANNRDVQPLNDRYATLNWCRGKDEGSGKAVDCGLAAPFPDLEQRMDPEAPEDTTPSAGKDFTYEEPH